MNRDGSKGAGVLRDRRRRSGRRFTAACKLRVLEEADACREPGEGAAWWRREGLYSSHLAEWRRARRAGSMEHTASGFRAGYGYEKGARLISRDGHSLFTNSLIPLRAVLGGTAVEYADALIPTSSSSIWGAVKQSL